MEPEKLEAEHLDQDLLELSVNLDDMSPELTAPVLEELLAHGAKDAWLVPIIMKKGRPGLMLQALVPQQNFETIAAVVFAHTTAMGLRYNAVNCLRLEKERLTAETPFGPVLLKRSRLDGMTTQVSPEYESCRQLAQETGAPLKQVFLAAQAAAQDFWD